MAALLHSGRGTAKVVVVWVIVVMVVEVVVVVVEVEVVVVLVVVLVVSSTPCAMHNPFKHDPSAHAVPFSFAPCKHKP